MTWTVVLLPVAREDNPESPDVTIEIGSGITRIHPASKSDVEQIRVMYSILITNMNQ